MRIMKDQVLASSSEEVMGLPPIPKETLRILYEQSPKERPLHQHHDIGMKPIGKIFNTRLVETKEGHARIVADVEIPDDVDFSEFGGYSIAFTGPPSFSTSRDGDDAITFALDRRYFSKEDLQQIPQKCSDGLSVGSASLYRYSLEGGVVIICVTFVACSVFAGFFSEAGKDLYKLAKATLSRLTQKVKDQGRVPSYEFIVEVDDDAGHYAYRVAVRAEEEHMWLLESGTVTPDTIRAAYSDTLDPAKTRRVVVTLCNNDPYFKIEYIEPK